MCGTGSLTVGTLTGGIPAPGFEFGSCLFPAKHLDLHLRTRATMYRARLSCWDLLGRPRPDFVMARATKEVATRYPGRDPLPLFTDRLRNLQDPSKQAGR